MTPPWLPRTEAFPKKNILTSIGALSTAIFATGVAGAVWVWPSTLSWALFISSLIPLAVAIWAYVYFAVREPDRLQTEDYRIQKEYVAKLVSYVDGKEVPIDIHNQQLTSKLITSPEDRS